MRSILESFWKKDRIGKYTQYTVCIELTVCDIIGMSAAASFACTGQGHLLASSEASPFLMANSRKASSTTAWNLPRRAFSGLRTSGEYLLIKTNLN